MDEPTEILIEIQIPPGCIEPVRLRRDANGKFVLDVDDEDREFDPVLYSPDE